MLSHIPDAENINQKQLRAAVQRALRAQLKQWDAQTEIEAALGAEIDDLDERICNACAALGTRVPKSSVEELAHELMEAASEEGSSRLGTSS